MFSLNIFKKPDDLSSRISHVLDLADGILVMLCELSITLYEIGWSLFVTDRGALSRILPK